jgi:hypothetical protein
MLLVGASLMIRTLISMGSGDADFAAAGFSRCEYRFRVRDTPRPNGGTLFCPRF